MILHLRAAVQQLYAAQPASFTKVRSALVAGAKTAGDADLAKQIGALRKPTVAAWAVNHFVREHADDLDELRRFAELLREAQRTLDADQLRALGRERSRRVDATAAQVETAAREQGVGIGTSVGGEIRDTLTALVADEDAERAVLTGALVKPLSYSGFGSVDIEGAAAIWDDESLRAVTTRSPEQAPAAVREDPEGGATMAATVDLAARRRERWERERRRLARAVDDAGRALERATEHVAALEARQEEARQGIADLERRISAARERLTKATSELEDASGIRDDHARARAAAQRALEDLGDA